jgi:cobalt/nickel transport system permease protein
MHIPDGFLSGKTLLATAAVSTAGLGVALRQVQRLPRRRIPLLGMCAAFVFAAQMLNFPVAGGTSGHLLGGVLVSAQLGPGAGVVVVSSVLIVQRLLFADGGLLSRVANVLNMAIVDSVCGYYLYIAVAYAVPGRRGQLAGVAFGSWAGAVIASVVCAGELFVSRTAPAHVVFPAMVNVHILIGVGEALISTLAFFAVMRSRPDLIDSRKPADSQSGASRQGRSDLRSFAAYGVLVALALALFASPFASTWPDGLDRVSEKLGFAVRAAPPIKSPLADYKVPGIGSVAVATALAGCIGTLVVLALSLVFAKILLAGAGRGDLPERASIDTAG